MCTLKGLKVLNNPFWGTTTAQDDVTLTVVWITLPIIWARASVTAAPALSTLGPAHRRRCCF